MESKQNKSLIVPIVVILLIIVVGGLAWSQYVSKSNDNEPTACTTEAKICPDGSSVGRGGPMCEFAECPQLDTSSWGTSSSSDELSLTFKYPKSISTPYIIQTDWPPILQATDEVFDCTEAGSETASGGITKVQLINGHTYCVTKRSEGAAGSMYTMYAYTFPYNPKEVALTFTFSLRFIQCGNYDEPNKTTCENERATFDIGKIVDQMVQTIK
ncbi:MAG: hypothetical protein JWN37_858 [Candidatus Nomurabacteria bacterium]|nr:hypothetical protein [Candidatus Nomurabacteria bacterium]